MSQTSQIAFKFSPHPYLGRDDFMVSGCNFEAVQTIDAWPQWPFFAVCLYGPAGCGKTHLSQIFSDKVSVATHYPYKIPCINASQITLDTPHRLFAEHNCLIVENLNEDIDNEAMFHLYNLYRNEGGFILFTSHQAPARLNVKLPDLRSRLNIIPAIAIGEPDDEMLSALIVKLFSDRQLSVSPEIINYMLNNMQRSFSYCSRLVEEIDNISLARKRAVSIPLVKEAFAALDSHTQGELFL